VSGTNTLLAAPHINRATLKEKGLTDDDLAQDREGLRGVFDLESGVRAVGDRRGRLRSPRREPTSSGERPGFSCSSTSASRPRRSRRPTTHRRPHDRRGRAAPAPRALPGVRLRQPLRQARQALPRADEPHQDDGRGAAVPLGRDLQDGQPAQRGHRRRRREIYEEGWKLGLKAVALYRDGCKASQPLLAPSDDKKKGGAKEAESRSRAKLRAAAPGAARRSRTALLDAAAPDRRATRVRLPKKRSGFTQEARVGGHKIFLRTGEYVGRHAGRDLHRHAQGGRRLPLADELLRHGGVAWACSTACRSRPSSTSSRSRASSRRAGRGPPEHQARDVHRRLHLPRARRRVPGALRPRARAASKSRS
jgi:ribonucleoside-diphosphate reductase alpha chain